MHKWILSIIFCFPLLSWAVAPNTKKVELNKVTTQIQQLQKTLILDQQQQQNIIEELRGIETSIGQLGQEINSLSLAIRAEQKQLRTLNRVQDYSTKQLAQQKIALEKLIRAIYQLGPTHSIKIILNQDNLHTAQRHLIYSRYLTNARLQLIEDMQQNLARLKKTVSLINRHQNNLKILLAKKQAQQTNQQSAQQQRQNLLNFLHQNVTSKQQQLSALLENQKALQDIVSQLKIQTEHPIKSAAKFNVAKGKLAWPVKGFIAASFGTLLDVGNQRLTGVIIKAPEGTPIHAVYEGKVIFANWLRGFGLLIIIHHANNYMSLYGRNHALYVKVGDRVNTGDTIATTGNSGGFDQPALYFEIRKNGLPINPQRWCG